jgi:hypothetical protein
VRPAEDAGDPELAWAGPARGRPFRLAGRRAAALGTERRGVTASQADGLLLTGPIRLTTPDGEAPAAANVVLAPRVLRRELAPPGATLSERIVLPAALPGLVVQWRAAGPGTWSGRIEVDLPPASAGSGRHVTDGGTLRVAGGPGDLSGCVLHVEPPTAWRLDAPERRRAVAEVRIAPGEPVTLLISAVDASGRLPALGPLAAVATHVRSADAEVTGAPGLRLTTGVRELDEGVAWTRAVLRAAAGRAGPAPVLPPAGIEGPELEALLGTPATRAWTVLGCLAAGEVDAAGAALDELGDHPLDRLAAAEWTAWTGQAGPLRRHLDAVLAGREPAHEPGLRRLVTARLADAAEALGERDRATELRKRITAEWAPGGPSGPTVTLPSLGRAPAGSLAAAALGESESARPRLPEGPADPIHPLAPLLARVRYALGEPEDAFALLRPALGSPVRDGPGIPVLTPALVAWALVTGLLGARPDAAFGRLRLAPSLPAAWSRFSAEGLRVGEATLDLDYAREDAPEGARHTWRFRPTAGAVPLMLVLEPTLPLGLVSSVLVDDHPAQVDATVRGRRVIVHLQLPLDSERSVTVHGAGSEPS